MEGHFGYCSNGYAFVSVSDEFAMKPFQLVKHEGFQIRYTIRKHKYPGSVPQIIFRNITYLYLAAHISLMMRSEIGLVEKAVLKAAEKKWRRRTIKFEVSSCKSFYHEDRWGNGMWIICLNVISSDLLELRRDLRLKKNINYNSHITVLEYELYN